jgi:NitT/TauT family transport system permease protein
MPVITDPTAGSVSDGLDVLETPAAPKTAAGSSRLSRFSRGRWPVSAPVGPVVALLGVLALWQGACSLRLSSTLPSPWSVTAALVGLWQDGSLVSSLSHSLLRTVAGFAASVVVGGLTGLLIHRFQPVRSTLSPVLSALQSLPAAGLVPLAVVVLGESESAVYAVILLGAAPAVALGLAGALRQIPPVLLLAGRSMGARGAAHVRHVLLPAALPGLVAALRQGWTFGWRALMTAELVTVTPLAGVGQILDAGRQRDDTALVMAAVVLILVIGIAVESAVFTPIERRVLRTRGLLPHRAVSGPGRSRPSRKARVTP